MNATITVIIPAHNAALNLGKCLASITSQLDAKDELIIIDDGSSDDTAVIAKRASKALPNVKTITHRQNMGCAKARKNGVENASGNYIMFLDADDELAEGSLSSLKDRICKEQADIIHFGLQFIDHTQGKGVRKKSKEAYFSPLLGSLNEEDIFEACYVRNKYMWNLTSKCFESKMLKKAFSYVSDERIQRGEDAYLYFIISFFAQSYYGIAEAKWYIYNFGCGQDSYRIIGVDEYRGFTDSVDAYRQMNLFLDAVPHTKTHEEGAALAGLRLAANCAWRLSLIRTDEKSDAIKELISRWGAPLAIAALRGEYTGRESDLFQHIKCHDLCARKREDKQYIATFYLQLKGGGAENVLRALIHVWHNLGYKVLLLLEKEPDPADLKNLEIDAYEILPPMESSHRSCYERELAIQTILNTYPIDLIVYHSWVNKALPWDLINFKTHGVSVIVHCHGIFSHYALFADPYFASMPYIYAQADAVVSLSKTDALFWRTFNANTFETINPPTFQVNEIPFVNTANKEQNILWLGRISPEKHPEDAIEVFEHVFERVPSATLTMVGSAGNDKYESKIEKLIEGSTAKENIRRVPWTNDQAAYYQNARLFVMTSDPKEGYPLTLAESKTFGLPCVIYDLPYLTLVEDGRGVLTAPFGRKQELASLITQVLTDDPYCEELSFAARQNMEDLANFDFESLWKNVFESARKAQAALSIPKLWAVFLSAYSNGSSLQIRNIERQRNDASSKIKKLQKQNEKYRNSLSWKIGRAFTWLPRRIRKAISR